MACPAQSVHVVPLLLECALLSDPRLLGGRLASDPSGCRQPSAKAQSLKVELAAFSASFSHRFSNFQSGRCSLAKAGYQASLRELRPCEVMPSRPFMYFSDNHFSFITSLQEIIKQRPTENDETHDQIGNLTRLDGWFLDSSIGK
jgi:hypothetical protein